MNRIDVSYMYVHLTWSLWFFIYLMACLYGLYTIWADLKGYRGRKEDWIMVGLVLTWIALAFMVYYVTEQL
jgi:hypothetical protein